MNGPRWKPSVTVAAIIEQDGRYLLVEEQTPEGLRLNNPAGHLEPGESPDQAAARECLEETARAFVPQALLGVYLARFERALPGGQPAEDITYLRFAYTGPVGEPEPGRSLDAPIVRTLWLTPDEVRAQAHRLRSPLVLQCIDDHQAGVRHPLAVVCADGSLLQPWRPV
jgi:8-oxo-dGTP pyrophosphatase MutT (NUDIX family)